MICGIKHVTYLHHGTNLLDAPPPLRRGSSLSGRSLHFLLSSFSGPSSFLNSRAKSDRLPGSIFFEGGPFNIGLFTGLKSGCKR